MKTHVLASMANVLGSGANLSAYTLTFTMLYSTTSQQTVVFTMNVVSGPRGMPIYAGQWGRPKCMCKSISHTVEHRETTSSCIYHGCDVHYAIAGFILYTNLYIIYTTGYAF